MQRPRMTLEWAQSHSRLDVTVVTIAYILYCTRATIATRRTFLRADSRSTA